MFLLSLIKWRKGNAVGKDPTLMVSLERGPPKCVRTTRFSWDTPSHVPNSQENPQVQEVSLEDVRTSIDSLEAHTHMFPTIKSTHKCKKCHSQKIWTSVLLVGAWVPPCPCRFSSGSITRGREYEPPPSSFQELHVPWVLKGGARKGVSGTQVFWGTPSCILEPQENPWLWKPPYTLMRSWTSREPMTLEISMYSWVFLTKNHLKSWVWLSSLDLKHTFWMFPNLKRIHKFGKLHVTQSTSLFLSSMGTWEHI